MTLVNGEYLLSNSEVQTHQRCPREWWLAWYRGLKPRQDALTGVRNVGTRVHIALASHYQPGGPGDALAELRRIQEEDMLILSARTPLYDDDDDYRLDESEAKLSQSFDLERVMIEGYLEWLDVTGADEHLEVIASETYVEVPLMIDPDVTAEMFGLPVKLIGKIDARVRHMLTGDMRFIDHKTGDFPRRQSLKINQQMKHYHLIEQLSAGPDEPRCGGALYNTLRRVKRTRASKPPYYRRDVVEHTPLEVANHHLQLQGVTSRILNTRHELEVHGPSTLTVPPQPSRFCEWGCAFYKICPMFDDGSRVEHAIDDLYQVGDPLDYYGGQEKGSEITEG